jgi:putative aminopeptidase FrvX
MDRELLAKVSNTPGIPGYEDAIQDVAREFLDGVCDEVSTDRVGNVIGIKRTTNPPANGDRPLRVILAAHADEVGMMVKHIDSDGFIRFQAVGGLNPQVLVSQLVIIHGRKKVNGVIVPRRNGLPLPALVEMLIDVGLSKAKTTRCSN